MEVPNSYSLALEVFEADPQHWGGAYVDDDGLLAVAVAHQSLDAAQETLQAAGITKGVKLVKVKQSLTQLDAQQNQVAEVVAAHANQVSTFGPNYKTQSIDVVMNSESDSLAGELRATATADGPVVNVSVESSNPTPAAT
ncbi:hypothetical protein GTR02_21790 [Kineococcus sp. R8]|uniref:hypothetical protein n=1 Tax=Kineococcus siccus TaxID=2696567 RepID=UPI00141205C2|nr:hypothetical protein [Kineococcus siccus]NAZ84437.1 hypothetical protein [Kineococcus siccus]